MRGRIAILMFALCVIAMTAACVAPETDGALPVAESEAPTVAPTTPPTAPPTEEQVSPTEPATAQPVSTLRPHIEPVGEIGEVGERVTGEAPQELLDAILDDAAARTGLDRSELAIVQDEAVVWPDGSLGCPEPGMMYTMALVDGYHIVVQAGEDELDYRTGSNNFFKLCENPAPLGRGGFPTR